MYDFLRLKRPIALFLATLVLFTSAFTFPVVASAEDAPSLDEIVGIANLKGGKLLETATYEMGDDLHFAFIDSDAKIISAWDLFYFNNFVETIDFKVSIKRTDGLVKKNVPYKIGDDGSVYFSLKNENDDFFVKGGGKYVFYVEMPANDPVKYLQAYFHIAADAGSLMSTYISNAAADAISPDEIVGIANLKDGKLLETATYQLGDDVHFAFITLDGAIIPAENLKVNFKVSIYRADGLVKKNVPYKIGADGSVYFSLRNGGDKFFLKDAGKYILSVQMHANDPANKYRYPYLYSYFEIAGEPTKEDKKYSFDDVVLMSDNAESFSPEVNYDVNKGENFVFYFVSKNDGKIINPADFDFSYRLDFLNLSNKQQITSQNYNFLQKALGEDGKYVFNMSPLTLEMNMPGVPTFQSPDFFNAGTSYEVTLVNETLLADIYEMDFSDMVAKISKDPESFSLSATFEVVTPVK